MNISDFMTLHNFQIIYNFVAFLPQNCAGKCTGAYWEPCAKGLVSYGNIETSILISICEMDWLFLQSTT